MALDIATLESELNDAISKADSVADVADKYADIAAKYTSLIPTVGPEVALAIRFLDTATKALDGLKHAVSSA